MSTLRSRFEKTGVPHDAVAPVITPAPVRELPLDPDKVLELAAAAVVTAPETVVETAVVEPVAPVLKRYEYQTHDEQGRPLGGKQVIEYTDEADLQKKWAAKEELLVRRLREVTRKQKLGIDDSPTPADVQFLNTAVDLQEKTLSPEQVFDLTQKLNDPTTFVEARDQLLESAMGVSPTEFRNRYNEQQQLVLQLTVKANYDTFEKTHSKDFDPSGENKQVLTDWMLRKGLAPTVSNFEYALSTLKESGLILEAPTVREVTPVVTPAPALVAAPEPAPVSTEPKPVVPAVTETRISQSEQPQQTRQQARVPSGLNNTNASVSGPTSVRTSLTVADFEKIPADELKKKLKDPSFAKLVNDLFEKKPVQS